MVHRMNPAELQQSKFFIEASFLDLNLSIRNGIVSTKYMINEIILILKLYISQFLIEMILGDARMYLNLFALQQSLLVLMFSIGVTYS